MINIERILCPTDLSSESDEALRYAVALACAYKAKLFLLYCQETIANGQVDLPPREISSLFSESLARHLGASDFCDINWEGLRTENVRDVGKAIVQEAAKQNIDLIVMRSRRRPHAAVLLGSTAETVSSTAPCPVLVTHPHEQEWVGMSSGEIDLHRILVAHDFSSDSELALNHGLSLAQEYQAEIHVLHVLTEASTEPELAWSDRIETNYTIAASRLQRAMPREVFLWCRIFNAVRHGKAYQEVLAYAEEHQIDLICMGASRNDLSLGTFFGSTADRVLRQAPCPVLIARPKKSAESCVCKTTFQRES